MIETEMMERLEGKGRLRDKDGRTLEVSYSISILRELHRSRTHDVESHSAGLNTIEASIDGVDLIQLYSIMGKTLTLEEGRLLDCFLENSNGHIIGAGGLRLST